MNGGYSPLRRWLREEREQSYWQELADRNRCSECCRPVTGSAWWFGSDYMCRECGWKRVRHGYDEAIIASKSTEQP